MSGHVFVVRGRIESVVHDAAVVPTSDSFGVRAYWRPLTGEPDAVVPEGWGCTTRVARARDGRPVWFVSVGATARIELDEVVARGVAALEQIGESDLARIGTRVANRVKPLVAMPVLGIAGGGHGQRTGELLRRQLEAYAAAARRLELDVAVVTPDRAVHAAAQHVRREWSSPIRDEDEAHARRLGALAAEGSLALFLGAGVSVPAGLPTWEGLLANLQGAHPEAIDMSSLGALDQAELLRRSDPDLGRRVADVVRRATRPALAHALAANLGCREAVTTNYDRLYETAVGAGGEKAASVLPWQHDVAARRWVLKLHGDVEKPESIVLSRRHFVRYDATTRPAGALLQSLLLTRHLLFLGASLADDNVVRLAHEVQEYRESYRLSGTVGTLVDVDSDAARRQLWRGELDWIDLPGANLPERARELEVFLDRVSLHATRDSSWLLDPVFDDLLDPAERDLAAEVRSLRARVGSLGEAWGPLREALDMLGAPRNAGAD